MNHMLKKIFSLISLASTVAYCAAPPTPSMIGPVAPYISYRSQGWDAADELAGWTQHVNLFDMDKLYGALAIKPKYTRTFKNNQIANLLFGTNNCNSKCATTVNISGSSVPNRGATDWLADYFYLPTDYASTLSFNPRIENALLDLNLYLGLDEWVCGMFFRAHMPITWTRWNLNFTEMITNPGSAAGDYAPGYFSVTTIPNTNLVQSFAAYASGSVPNFTEITGNPEVLSPTFRGLQFAKIDNCKRTKSGIADLQLVWGYNFVNDEDYHLGIGLRGCVPTGNRPQGEFLFEPIVGNGKHWELGAHITGHAMLWRSCDEESAVGLYVDANITHLFNSCQRRTFDLVGKPLSRYMLAEKLGVPVDDLLLGGGPTTSLGGTPANFQFQNEFSPVANFTTQDVQVSVGAQGDLAAQFSYTNCGIAWDIGYNFWGRTCEKIKANCYANCSNNCTAACPPLTPITFMETTWALKGDSYVIGFLSAAVAVPALPEGAPVNLSATQSAGTTADITGGSNQNQSVPSQNEGIDFAQLAFGLETPLNISPTLPSLQTNTSIQPVFITAQTIANTQGTKAISHKVYTNLSYQWVDADEWVPYLGIGGFAEFGSVNQGNCGVVDTTCNTNGDCANTSNCIRAAVSQWGIWAKLGVAFN